MITLYSRFLPLLIIATGLLGCTRPQSQTATIAVQLPQGTSNKSNAMHAIEVQSEPSVWGELSPKSFSEVGCYAVIVDGDGVTGSPRSCTGPDGTTVSKGAIFSGFHKAGEQVKIGIEPGSNRLISVIAVKLRDGAECPSGDSDILNKRMISSPVFLGSVTTSIAVGDNNIQIPLSFSNVKPIDNCSWQQDPSVIATSLVQPAFPSNGRWNDYVKRDSSKSYLFDAPDITCDGSEVSFSGIPCFHAGEKRRVKVSGASSCTGLTAQDSLGAFNWSCKVVSGSVEFHNVSSKSDKILRVLTNATGFNPMEVRIYKDGALADRTGYSIWWPNQVKTVQTNSNEIFGFSEPGVVYKVNGPIKTLQVSGDRISVVLPDSSTVASPTADGCAPRPDGCAIVASYSKYLWIEGGNFVSQNNLSDGLVLSNVRLSQIHGFKGAKFTTAVSLSSSMYNSLHSMSMTKNERGLALDYSNRNDFYAVTTSSSWDGIILVSSENNSFYNLTSAFNTNGIMLNLSPKNTFNFSSLISNRTRHVFMYSAEHNQFYNTAAVFAGITAFHMTTSDYTVIHEVVTDLNVRGIYATDSNGLSVHGLINLGNSNGCTTVFSSVPSYGCPTQNAEPQTVISASIGSPFIGRITSQDIINQSNTNGASNSVGSDILDLLNFQNPYRLWGADTGTLESSDQISLACVDSGNCSIFDFRLKSTDTILRNAFEAVSGSPCPAEAQTERAHPITGSWGLANAIEINDDSVGNDNGLCESGERCIYGSNLGAYQGEGNLAQACTFSDTANVSNVTLLSYSQNGG